MGPAIPSRERGPGDPMVAAHEATRSVELWVSVARRPPQWGLFQRGGHPRRPAANRNSTGGDEETRTLNRLHAKQVHYQLCYIPVFSSCFDTIRAHLHSGCQVEHRGFEPRTFALPVRRATNCANAPDSRPGRTPPPPLPLTVQQVIRQWQRPRNWSAAPPSGLEPETLALTVPCAADCAIGECACCRAESRIPRRAGWHPLGLRCAVDERRSAREPLP
jgi:hypothetical protein